MLSATMATKTMATTSFWKTWIVKDSGVYMMMKSIRSWSQLKHMNTPLRWRPPKFPRIKLIIYRMQYSVTRIDQCIANIDSLNYIMQTEMRSLEKIKLRAMVKRVIIILIMNLNSVCPYHKGEIQLNWKRKLKKEVVFQVLLQVAQIKITTKVIIFKISKKIFND